MKGVNIDDAPIVILWIYLTKFKKKCIHLVKINVNLLENLFGVFKMESSRRIFRRARLFESIILYIYFPIFQSSHVYTYICIYIDICIYSNL